MTGITLGRLPGPDTVRLVWLDLETTGLEPLEGLVLEIGLIVTDLRCQEIHRQGWVLSHPAAALIRALSPEVFGMHQRSGLLLDCLKMSAWNPETAWSELVRFLDWQARQGFVLHLAGSSVHFDRRWLQHHCPEVLQIVHRRMLDVSGYLVAFPGLLPRSPNEVAHRAIADLEFSIDQHQKMLELVEHADPNWCGQFALAMRGRPDEDSA